MASKIEATFLQKVLEDLKGLHQLGSDSISFFRICLRAGRENPFARDSGCLYRQIIHSDAKDSRECVLVRLSTNDKNMYYKIVDTYRPKP